MTIHHLTLNASWHGRLSAALGVARSAVSAAGAWVEEARSLGSLVLVVRFESESLDAARLASSLIDAGAVLDPTSAQAASALPSGVAATGSLTVTLIHEGPDELVDVPSVPG